MEKINEQFSPLCVELQKEVAVVQHVSKIQQTAVCSVITPLKLHYFYVLRYGHRKVNGNIEMHTLYANMHTQLFGNMSTTLIDSLASALLLCIHLATSPLLNMLYNDCLLLLLDLWNGEWPN